MGEKMRSFQKAAFIINNEDGSVILAAFLILVLLTIAGIASTNISNTEVQIAGHTVAYQRNFYRAEGATIEAVELLEAQSNPKNNPPAWLEPNLDAITSDDLQNGGFWESGTGSVNPANSNLQDTRYVAVSAGVASGSSLSMGSSKVHGYGIYGRCSPPERGATIVQIGYLKAF